MMIGELTMIKSVDKTIATIGSVLSYTIVLNNTGNLLLSNIFFKDIIPSGATFNAGSVKVNGVIQSSYNPNTGFNLGSLLIGGSITVNFLVTVTSLPASNTIINKASTTYDYLIVVPISGSSESNNVTTNINVITLNMIKSSNKIFVTHGNVITYTITIKNNGNVIASGVNFKDIVANLTTFINGSVFINGINQPTYNPNNGFTLPNISVGATITITFQVLVN